MESLWNLNDTKDCVNEPKSIVEKQGEILKKATEYVYLEINQIEILPSFEEKYLGKKNHFIYEVLIKSEYIDSYSFEIFTICYDIPFYPLVIVFNSEIALELYGDYEKNFFDCPNEEDFLIKLELLLKSEHVNDVINTLRNMSKRLDPLPF